MGSSLAQRRPSRSICKLLPFAQTAKVASLALLRFLVLEELDLAEPNLSLLLAPVGAEVAAGFLGHKAPSTFDLDDHCGVSWSLELADLWSISSLRVPALVCIPVRGRVMVNVEPWPSVEVNAIVPPTWSRIALTM